MSLFPICFGITVVFAILVASSNGLCCGYNPVAVGLGCCGYGACNIFCCNCDGRRCNPDCQSLNSGHTDKASQMYPTGGMWQLSKSREENTPGVDLHSIPEGNATLAAFIKIDKNGDGVIDFEEAVVYYQTNIWTDDENFRAEFNKIDANEDGTIQQCEFDSSLKCKA